MMMELGVLMYVWELQVVHLVQSSQAGLAGTLPLTPPQNASKSVALAATSKLGSNVMMVT